jgi:hypothetical protein
MDWCVENWGGDGELETSKNKLRMFAKVLALCNFFVFHLECQTLEVFVYFVGSFNSRERVSEKLRS